ncbi:hypothetical protein CCH79_00011199 [Gambusia affinis]|uniref:Glutamine amidotransferase type-2 domain-containing protein n=1 Tax=Gambusia affinis TaxID=33528 RepID=A0A315URQ3_GAMAF|nr:hypothetical protein CCH79_00011199 [Gambusia affinis]
MRHGVGLSTSSDSELITQLLAQTPPMEELDTPDWVARIKNLMTETPTSYSLLIMFKDVIYAVRDPYGNRPLSIGRLVPVSRLHSSGAGEEDTEGWVVSSESCSFQSIGAKYYREVLPGEIVQISRFGVKSLSVIPRPEGDPPAFCIFEYVYFARPDSIFEGMDISVLSIKPGQMVYTVRQRCGRQLAIEAPTDVDLVSTVPESATPAALGYAQQSGLPYTEVLCKNRYVGRTFIQPNTRLRQLGVAKKFGVLTDNFAGKRVVLIDDSIVRGNTISPIIKLLREAGAKEVHIRVASPPIKFPCYMGINIPTKEELIANKPEFKDIAGYIGADSVEYLTVEGLVSAVQEGISSFQKENVGSYKEVGHCTACLTGKYPIYCACKPLGSHLGLTWRREERLVPVHPGVQVRCRLLGSVFTGAIRDGAGFGRPAASQHLIAVTLGPRGEGVVLVPEAFGLRVAVTPLLPVALPQDGAVGRQGKCCQRREGRGPPGLRTSSAQTARKGVEGSRFVLAHKLVAWRGREES